MPRGRRQGRGGKKKGGQKLSTALTSGGDEKKERSKTKPFFSPPFSELSRREKRGRGGPIDHQSPCSICRHMHEKEKKRKCVGTSLHLVLFIVGVGPQAGIGKREERRTCVLSPFLGVFRTEEGAKEGGRSWRTLFSFFFRGVQITDAGQRGEGGRKQERSWLYSFRLLINYLSPPGWLQGAEAAKEGGRKERERKRRAGLRIMQFFCTEERWRWPPEGVEEKGGKKGKKGKKKKQEEEILTSYSRGHRDEVEGKKKKAK